MIDPADATAQDTKTVLAAEGLLRSKEQVLWRSALPPMWNAARGSPAECCRREMPFKEIKL
ncbi:MAG: hypothetical protein ACLRXQ_03930 [Phascolarctobacterium faecium]